VDIDTNRSQQADDIERVADEAVEEAKRLRRRRILLKQLSILEIMIYFGAGFGFAYHQLLGIGGYEYLNPQRLFFIFTSPELLLSLGMCFLAYFSVLLNGISPAVSLLTRMSGPFVQSQTSTDNILLAHREPKEGLHIDSALKLSHQIHSSRRTEAITRVTRIVDAFEDDFATYIARSQDAARIAQRRPNALLFVGTFIAAAGLIFFVLTLPGNRYGLLDSIPAAISDQRDFWSSTVQLFPRLLMLIFIQVLAGFFLRQYRSAVEDFRYYESVLRHREAQYLSYSLRKNLDDKKALLKFADELLREREFGLLHRSQSTMALEAQRAETNEFGTLYERIAALIAREEPKTKKDGAAAPKKPSHAEAN
jgi:hypothetical protein